MAELQTLTEIFNSSIFRIPDYQRGYSWGWDQLKAFWEDLISIPDGRNHYTGVLTIKKVNDDITNNWVDDVWQKPRVQFYHVIDGQQRLTTISIALNEIVELMKTSNKDVDLTPANILLYDSISMQEINESFLFKIQPKNNMVRSYKFGYEKDNPSFNYLKYKIYGEDGGQTLQETLYTRNLENAKLFFEKYFGEYYEKFGEEGLYDLYLRITTRLMFNVYNIADEFDVFVAFETMNNRGKPLSDLELLKNRLIYLSTLFDKSQVDDNERDVLRRDINNSWRNVYHNLGLNKDLRLSDDEYLRAHWAMYFGYSRNRGDEYRKFLLNEHFIAKNILDNLPIVEYELTHFEVQSFDVDNDVEDDLALEVLEDLETEVTSLNKNLTASDLKNYAISLSECSGYWFNLYNPNWKNELTEDEKEWLDKLNRVGIMYFRPLILASFASKQVTPEERVALFKNIERYIFVGFRLFRARSSFGSSDFSRAANKLIRGEINIQTIIDNLHESLENFIGSGDQCMTKSDEFGKYINRLRSKQNGFYSWSDIKYFLFEYEYSLFKERGAKKKPDWDMFVKNVKDKVSIEHIYPQTPENVDWPKFAKYEKAKRHALTSSLGNLVPLSQIINSRMQNYSFQTKKTVVRNENGTIIRHAYKNGSHSEVEVGEYKDWTAQTILERGMKLLTFMESRWGVQFKDVISKKEILGLAFLK